MTVRYLAMFAVRRLVALIVLLGIISFGIFSLLYFAPGNVVQTLLGDHPATPQLIRQLRDEYHLNDSFLQQYWIWARGALHGNFGRSALSQEPVSSIISERAPVTAFLGCYAFLIAMVSGVGLGILAAVRKRTVVDRTIVGASVMAVSLPVFVSGVALLYLFTAVVPWFPAYGPGSGFSDRLVHMTLPAFALGITGSALVIKLTRAPMIAALEQDHVAFARARGLSRWRVLVHYALRNALVPIVTAAGIVLGFMLTGAVLVEVTFALPGIGSLLTDSVNGKDVPVIQGLAMVIAATIITINFLTDVAYLFVDPRIRLGRAPG